MLCTKCEDVLTLPLGFENHDSVSHPVNHHDSYTALWASADAGCQLCDLVRHSREWKYPGYRHSESQMPEGETTITVMRRGASKSLSSGIVAISFIQRELEYGVRKYDEALSERLELLALPEDPAAALFPARKIDWKSDSNATYAIASAWLENCISSHALCGNIEEMYLPTRVIDVGPADGSQEPRLFITDQRKGSWVTLSHCWGEHVPVKLTTDTFLERCAAIPLADLSENFRDAVIITRRLGFQYLWIDSLCIIQDSEEDWLRESMKMASVYQHCALNIAAEAAFNSSIGIFRSANWRRLTVTVPVELPVYHTVNGSREKLGSVLACEKENVGIAPLNKRAWVVQESVLSPRRLRYAQDQIYWSCRVCSGFDRQLSESNPSESKNPVLSEDGMSLLSLEIKPLPPLQDLIEDGSGVEALVWWYGLMKNYIPCHISYNKDRLPAIAGLAKEVSVRTGYHYHAGLFFEDFHRGLLWNALGVGTTSLHSPSWSWASISDKDINRETDNGLFGYPITSHLTSYRGKPHLGDKSSNFVAIIKIDLTMLNNDVFGMIEPKSLKYPSLTLRGCWRHARSWGAAPSLFFNTIDLQIHQNGSSIATLETVERRPPGPYSKLLICNFDEAFKWDGADPWEEILGRNLSFLQIGRFDKVGKEGNGVMFALILETVNLAGRNAEADWFRRIGTAEIPDDMVKGWEVRDVLIL